MRRLSVITIAASLCIAPVTAHAATVEYYGGPVISSIIVHQIVWTANVPARTQSDLAAFYTAITGSAYFDWLGEYDTVGKNGKDGQPGSNQRITRGTFGTKVVITPSNTATTLTDADIAAELEAQIAANNVPVPEFDATGNATTYYAIDFPSTYTLKVGTAVSCQTFCFSSGTATINGKAVPFGILPDVSQGACAVGCGNDPDPFNNVTANHAELLLNVVTSPQVAGSFVRPWAWASSSSGRIGEVCNAQHGTIAGYTVNKGWSEKMQQCIVSNPTLPKCDGSTYPCTPCTPSDCTGSKPACETRGSSASYGLCVACVDDATCSGATPKCDTMTDTCGAAPAPDAGPGSSDAGPGSSDAGVSTVPIDAGNLGGSDDAGSNGVVPSGNDSGSGSGCSCRATERADVSDVAFAIAAVAIALGARRRRRC